MRDVEETSTPVSIDTFGLPVFEKRVDVGLDLRVRAK